MTEKHLTPEEEFRGQYGTMGPFMWAYEHKDVPPVPRLVLMSISNGASSPAAISEEIGIRESRVRKSIDDLRDRKLLVAETLVPNYQGRS